MAIRKFIEEYAADNETRPYQKAKRLLGVVESGITDLGQNHRKYVLNQINTTASLRELAGGWSEKDARELLENHPRIPRLP